MGEYDLKGRFYDDLLVVLILTLITVICMLIPGSKLTAPFIYIPYILLLLFLPGYSLLAANIPDFAHYSLLKRVILSILLSLVFSIFIAALLTYTPLKILNGVILYFIGAFTIILSLVAIMKRKSYHYVHFIEPLGEPVPVGQQRYEEHPLEIEVIENSNEEVINDQEEDPEEPELERPAPKKVEAQPVKADKQDIMDDEQELRPDKNVTPTNPRPQRRPPKRFAYLDLVLILVLTIVCAVIIFIPSLNKTIFNGVTVNTVVGLVLMLFLPGYAIVATLSTRKTDLNVITRLVLSFGISYFLTTVIGLILNYTSMGSSLEPILQVLTGLTFIFILTALVMRMRTPPKNRFEVGFARSPNSKGTSSPGGSPTIPTPTGSHRTRNIMMVGVVVVIALFIAAPTAFNYMIPEEKSTEFYILGPDGQNITSYPDNLTSGENGTVTVVLVNHENQETDYRIKITSNQTDIGELNVKLKPDEKKEIPYTFTVGDPGTKKLEFSLFKLPDLNNVYHSKSFWVTILELVTNETATTTETPTTYQEPVYQEPVYQTQPTYQEPVLDEYMT
jgi:uncharacterized membrane protein